TKRLSARSGVAARKRPTIRNTQDRIGRAPDFSCITTAFRTDCSRLLTRWTGEFYWDEPLLRAGCNRAGAMGKRFAGTDYSGRFLAAVSHLGALIAREIAA